MNPQFFEDFYKIGHVDQYPSDTEQVWSNWTARSTRVPGQTHVVFFGLQYFIKHILRDAWSKFFWQPRSEMVKEYRELIGATLGVKAPRTDHLEYLHQLGHLPLDIWALPEGSSVPIGVPMLVISNTDPKCFWLPNFLETVLSAHLWKPTTSANTALRFRKLFMQKAKEFGEKDLGFVDWQGHDFSYRGMSGNDDAIMSGMGHLLSFNGTDTIPAILAAKEYYGAPLSCGGSVPACYDDETEILTNLGFMPFHALRDGDLVAQYTDAGTIEFVPPEEQFACPYEGNMIAFTKAGYRYVDALVTPNHKMVKRTRFNGKLTFFEASKGNYSSKSTVVVAGKSAFDGPGVTPLDSLRIAFQADGAFPARKGKYTGEKTGTLPIRFSFKKHRKAHRLDEILSALGYEHSKELYENGYYSYWIKVPKDVEFRKDLSWIDLAATSAARAKGLIEEFSKWDGSKKRAHLLFYYSTNEYCANVAQSLGVLAGYKTQLHFYEDLRTEHERSPNYTVTFSTHKSEVTGEDVNKVEVPYSGTVYCVKVPSGMVVTRRNGVVLISGNTEHSVMCSGTQEGEFETFKRLITQTYPTGIVSIVSDTWDLWRVLTDYVPRLREVILARDGKVVIRPDSGDPIKIMIGDPEAPEGSPARAGALELLAQAMGTDGHGHINKAGLIYGDGISPERAEAILKGCIAKGLSPFNVVFGIGSFSYEMVTRDTYNFAMKATAVKRAGKILDIFKKPVTDNFWKTSLTGIPIVYRERTKDGRVDFFVRDHGQPQFLDKCAFQKVYSNGKLLAEETFDAIRQRVRA